MQVKIGHLLVDFILFHQKIAKKQAIAKEKERAKKQEEFRKQLEKFQDDIMKVHNFFNFYQHY